MQHQLYSSMRCKSLMSQDLIARHCVLLVISCICSQQALFLESLWVLLMSIVCKNWTNYFMKCYYLISWLPITSLVSWSHYIHMHLDMFVTCYMEKHSWMKFAEFISYSARSLFLGIPIYVDEFMFYADWTSHSLYLESLKLWKVCILFSRSSPKWYFQNDVKWEHHSSTIAFHILELRQSENLRTN